MKLSEKDYNLRLNNLKKECLSRLVITISLGTLLGILAQRSSKEFLYFWFCFGLSVIIGLIICFCKYLKGKKRIDNPNIIQEDKQDDE